MDELRPVAANSAMMMPDGKTACIPAPSLAMVYSPYQAWDKIYDADIGFTRGTIFQELDKPFIGEEAVPHV